jgi:hypothetical protein
MLATGALSNPYFSLNFLAYSVNWYGTELLTSDLRQLSTTADLERVVSAV